MTEDADFAEARARAERHSPYLRGLLRREAALYEQIITEGPDAALKTAVERLDVNSPGPSLRHSKAGMALVVALADLAGAWSLEKVTDALSDHADAALDFAIRTAFAERDEASRGFSALALGKMGSRELNYSSDIDIIFLHDPDLLPRRNNEDPTEAAVRIARRASTLLSERTADGYCWRVDLRLRPDPDSTPSSLPVGAAEVYYQSEALAWERSAFIRSRAAAGDVEMGERFLRDIAPFIWRRSLDYSALADIGEVSYQIRDHFAEGQKLGPGFDLKRGRGGIREIEFFAQIHQLIFGGREPALRAPATLDALRALSEAGRIPSDDADFLSAAYRQFRTVEHRLQMIADQQTHVIPRQKAEREAVAQLYGLPNWKSLEAELSPNVRGVAKRYDKLLESNGEDRRGPRIPHDRDQVELWGKKNRVADPVLLATLLEGWRNGRPRSLRAPESRRAFEVIAPALVLRVGIGRTGRDDLLRLDRMIQALPSGVQFWRLLAANPPLAEVVARILTTMPLLSDALAARPDLIDVLLEPASDLPTVDSARQELRMLTSGLDEEALFDRVRRWTAERRFQLSVALLDGHASPLAASAVLSRMAEATVELLAERVTDDFARRHGRVADGELVVLALGRFGGGELTFQSDLDLSFTFTGSFQAQSDGTRPLSASAWYNRAGQRLISALTVPTAGGTLYEVDTRLRPSGNDGLLVVSLDSFAQYQKNSAELWEIMSLVRARPVTGSVTARAAAETVLVDILTMPRDRDAVVREALSVRRHMAKHKPAKGPFDVKLARGGLVDLEFIVEARALIAGIKVSTSITEAASVVAPDLVEASRLMQSILVMLRLVQPHDSSASPGPATGAVLARACGEPSFAALKAALSEAKRAVHRAWIETFGKY